MNPQEDYKRHVASFREVGLQPYSYVEYIEEKIRECKFWIEHNQVCIGHVKERLKEEKELYQKWVDEAESNPEDVIPIDLRFIDNSRRDIEELTKNIEDRQAQIKEAQNSISVYHAELERLKNMEIGG